MEHHRISGVFNPKPDLLVFRLVVLAGIVTQVNEGIPLKKILYGIVTVLKIPYEKPKNLRGHFARTFRCHMSHIKILPSY